AAPCSTFDGSGNSRSISGASNCSSTEALAFDITRGTLLKPNPIFNAELASCAGDDSRKVGNGSADCAVPEAGAPNRRSAGLRHGLNIGCLFLPQSLTIAPFALCNRVPSAN